jgi:hypothetical protein
MVPTELNVPGLMEDVLKFGAQVHIKLFLSRTVAGNASR